MWAGCRPLAAAIVPAHMQPSPSQAAPFQAIQVCTCGAACATGRPHHKAHHAPAAHQTTVPSVLPAASDVSPRGRSAAPQADIHHLYLCLRLLAATGPDRPSPYNRDFLATIDATLPASPVVTHTTDIPTWSNEPHHVSCTAMGAR
jgi:hypothetical protein